METITTQRSGQAPLQFEGEKISSASSHRTQGPCENRWYTMDLYRLSDSRHVLCLEYHTHWQGEEGRSYAWVCPTHTDVHNTLAAHNPLSDVLGFPPGSQWDARRENLERNLRFCWDAAVSELLTDLPEKI